MVYKRYRLLRFNFIRPNDQSWTHINTHTRAHKHTHSHTLTHTSISLQKSAEI